MTYRPVGIEEITAKALPVIQKYNISKAAVFGSCARGDMCHGSDIDLLVDTSGLSGGLVFVEIKRKLEYALGRKVDLISYSSLNYSHLKSSILSEAKVIYEKRQ